MAASINTINGILFGFMVSVADDAYQYILYTYRYLGYNASVWAFKPWRNTTSIIICRNDSTRRIHITCWQMRSRHTRSSYEADTLVASYQHRMQCLWLACGWLFFRVTTFKCTTSYVLFFLLDPCVAFASLLVIILRNPARDTQAAHFASLSFGSKKPSTIMTFIATNVLKSHNNNFASNECRYEVSCSENILLFLILIAFCCFSLDNLHNLQNRDTSLFIFFDTWQRPFDFLITFDRCILWPSVHSLVWQNWKGNHNIHLYPD